MRLSDGFSLHLSAVSREHQHTQPATGLMLWDSSLVLSRLLLSCPRLFAGRRVLDLGCGCLALCSIAAATAADADGASGTAAAASGGAAASVAEAADGGAEAALRCPAAPAQRSVHVIENGASFPPTERMVEPPSLVVASDGDEAALALLRRNLEKNGLPHYWSVGRGQEGTGSGEGMPDRNDLERADNRIVPIHVFHLSWGSSCHHEELRAITNRVSKRNSGLPSQDMAGNDGFDLLIGADVVYQRHAVPLLFQSARALLKDCSSSQETCRGAGFQDRGSFQRPLLLLCHITRHVSEGDIVSEAHEAGFQLAQEELEVATGEKRADLALKLSKHVDAQQQQEDADKLFRILCFVRSMHH